MATNLTPEQLAQLQRLFSTPQGSGDGNAYMPNTVDYGGQTYKQDNAGGFVGTGPLYGDKQYHFNNYDTSGAQTAEGDARMSDWSPEKDFLMAMAVLATMGAAGGAMAGAGAAGGAGGAGAGAAGAGAGGMVNGAFLGEGALSGIGAWDGALAAAGGAGGAAGAAGADSLMNGLNGSDIMSDAFVSNGGVGAGGFGGTSGSYMSNLVNGTGSLGSRIMGGTGAGSTGPSSAASGSNLLGIGASLLGGALGSQGQQAEQSSTRDIPEWLKPYVTNTLDKSQNLFNTQMSPEYQQRWTNLGNQAQGLLAQPMAGNGFNKFFPNR